MAAFDSDPCTLDHADLVELVRQHPRIAVRMLQSVTERLVRDTSETLSRRLGNPARDEVIGHAKRRGIVLLDIPGREARAGVPPRTRGWS